MLVCTHALYVVSQFACMLLYLLFRIFLQDETASAKQIFSTVSTMEILDHDDSWLMSTIGDFMEVFFNQLKYVCILHTIMLRYEVL